MLWIFYTQFPLIFDLKSESTGETEQLRDDKQIHLQALTYRSHSLNVKLLTMVASFSYRVVCTVARSGWQKYKEKEKSCTGGVGGGVTVISSRLKNFPKDALRKNLMSTFRRCMRSHTVKVFNTYPLDLITTVII